MFLISRASFLRNSRRAQACEPLAEVLSRLPKLLKETKEMSYYARVLAAALCAGAVCAQSFAQNPPAPAPTPNPANAPPSPTTAAPQRRAGRSPAATPAADPAVAARREAAVSLIARLAEEARGFRDETLRARTLAQAADTLWETERESARALFRRAWEAADATDRESARRLAEERQRAMGERRGTFVLPRASNLRGEVLRLATRRDRALGEEFLAQLAEARNEEAANLARNPQSSGPGQDAQQQPAAFDPTDPPLAYRQRLQLARQLLDEGDIERALQIAEPALERVTQPGITFLSSLREKNATLGDGRYAALLARAGNDPVTDAASVSLLSSYIFSPYTYTIVSRSGSMTAQEREQTAPPAGLPPALREAFFNFAFRTLMRPLPPPEQDNTIAGRSGTYFTIARLLPLFEQFKPEQASVLRTQLAALAPETPENVRNPRNPMLTRGLESDSESSHDAVQEALDRAERATTSAERDRAYTTAALAAAQKGEARARDLAERIEESDLRARVRAHVMFQLLQRAINRRATDEALRLARDSDITHTQRVWALTQVAGWLLETDRERATELLDEAGTEARRIGGAEPDRPRTLLAVATHMVKADPGRAWELASEIVRAANSATDFTGADAQLRAQLQTQGMVSMTNFDVPEFNLTGLFAALARHDMERAVELSRGFVGESPRATATLAIARAVLGGEERQRSERRVTADAEVVR